VASMSMSSVSGFRVKMDGSTGYDVLKRNAEKPPCYRRTRSGHVFMFEGEFRVIIIIIIIIIIIFPKERELMQTEGT